MPLTPPVQVQEVVFVGVKVNSRLFWLASRLTDGVPEAYSPAEELFGIDRALGVVRAHRDRPAREIVDRLYEAVHAFCGPRVRLDDLTAIIVKVGTSP